MEVDEYQTQVSKFQRVSSLGSSTTSDNNNNNNSIKIATTHHGGGVNGHESGEMDLVGSGGVARLCGWPASRIVRVSRASGGKDRHSKVLTSKGLRDRRVRLSVSTAIQFYDLQDRLGYDQPSKAVEWLLKAAASSIDELPDEKGTVNVIIYTEKRLFSRVKTSVRSLNLKIAYPGRSSDRGYSLNKKGYKLYSLDSKQFLFSRDTKLSNDNERDFSKDDGPSIHDESAESFIPAVVDDSADTLASTIGEHFQGFNQLFQTHKSDVEEVLSEQTIRRSTRKASLPSRLHDYKLNGKVNYGLNKYVNYTNLSSENYSFMTNLVKPIEPKSYREAATDAKWENMSIGAEKHRNGRVQAMTKPYLGNRIKTNYGVAGPYGLRRSLLPNDLENGTDYLEFLYWLALKFNNYWEIDKNTQNGLWEFYVNERTKGTIGDLDNEARNERYKKTCSDTFYKPYLDSQDAKDICEVIDREYSLIPILTHRDIDNPDKLCRTEEFTVIRNLIGTCEEFVTISPSKVRTIERAPGSMTCIYHELFSKKDRGW
uniref:TCP domain-containing protein n=1 Tax=Tanacetum cinerariifolium TaxID=118510 RepID=A0A6L2J4J2_TANCI|nr:hypothetical protein [Tanacetum cinerariifolium]